MDYKRNRVIYTNISKSVNLQNFSIKLILNKQILSHASDDLNKQAGKEIITTYCNITRRDSCRQTPVDIFPRRCLYETSLQSIHLLLANDTLHRNTSPNQSTMPKCIAKNKYINSYVSIQNQLVSAIWIVYIHSTVFRFGCAQMGTTQRLMIVKFTAQTQMKATHLGFTDLGNEKK